MKTSRFSKPSAARSFLSEVQLGLTFVLFVQMLPKNNTSYSAFSNCGSFMKQGWSFLGWSMLLYVCSIIEIWTFLRLDRIQERYFGRRLLLSEWLHLWAVLNQWWKYASNRKTSPTIASSSHPSICLLTYTSVARKSHRMCQRSSRWFNDCWQKKSLRATTGSWPLSSTLSTAWD